MTYLRSLFLNFLIVFFTNHINPGIEIKTFEHVPNIGADILFSAILGLLNSLIFPVFVLSEIKTTLFKIVITSFVITISLFLFISFFDFGIKVSSFFGFVFSSLSVVFVASFSNYLEYKNSYRK